MIARLGQVSIVLAGVAGLAALAWVDVLRRAGAMARDAGAGMGMAMGMPQPMPWSVPDLLAAGAMWSVMMIAMMLPSAGPVLLFLSGMHGARVATDAAAAPAAFFVAGFLAVWLAWSWLAAGLQWVLSPAASIRASPASQREGRVGAAPTDRARSTIPSVPSRSPLKLNVREGVVRDF